MTIDRVDISGKPQAVCGTVGEYLNNEVHTAYNSIEWNLDDETTNYSLKTNQETAFVGLNKGDGVVATHMELRTDRTITFRLNANTNHAVTVASTDSPYTVDTVEITDVFLTNASGDAAAIKIFLS